MQGPGKDHIISNPSQEGREDRQFWLQTLCEIAEPVLEALSRGELRKRMPVECVHGPGYGDRKMVSHMEAFGRLMAGMAPWLELGASKADSLEDPAETLTRIRFTELYQKAVTRAVDPHSPDFMNYCRYKQPLVDTAYLAQALIRAPEVLYNSLPGETQRRLIDALTSSRRIMPWNNNWLLFSAMVEAAVFKYTGTCDMKPVKYALKKLSRWYVGDGTYGDGPQFHWDYYNSFVIHPMLLDITRVFKGNLLLPLQYQKVLRRAKRYCVVMERLISPEGTFPPIGRSLPYRFGAFHLPAQLALWKELPDGISPPQLRSALTSVIRRIMEAPGTFDESGWLRVGFFGSGPEIAEPYLSTGSMYLCAVGLLPLGLGASDPFWSLPGEPWTSKKLWSGQKIGRDKALRGGCVSSSGEDRE